MIHWQTWDFQHSDSDQSTTLFSCSCISLLFSWQSVKNPEGRPSTYLLVHIYAVSLINPPTSLKHQTESIRFDSPNHRALHGHPPSIHARHDEARPCDNSLLRQMVSVTLTDQSLFLRMIASQGHQRRTSRLFPKAGNSNCLKSTASLDIPHWEILMSTWQSTKEELEWSESVKGTV